MDYTEANKQYALLLALQSYAKDPKLFLSKIRTPDLFPLKLDKISFVLYVYLLLKSPGYVNLKEVATNMQQYWQDVAQQNKNYITVDEQEPWKVRAKVSSVKTERHLKAPIPDCICGSEIFDLQVLLRVFFSMRFEIEITELPGRLIQENNLEVSSKNQPRKNKKRKYAEMASNNTAKYARFFTISSVSTSASSCSTFSLPVSSPCEEHVSLTSDQKLKMTQLPLPVSLSLSNSEAGAATTALAASIPVEPALPPAMLTLWKSILPPVVPEPVSPSAKLLQSFADDDLAKHQLKKT